jgi:3-polyprenyl-4-hydroxybenzoate decarboxylase
MQFFDDLAAAAAAAAALLLFGPEIDFSYCTFIVVVDDDIVTYSYQLFCECINLFF